MKTFFFIPRNVNEARTQANIARRAETLFTEGGYTMYDMGYGLYSVVKPGCEEAFPFSDYGYDVDTRKHTCTCEAHAEYGDCKHHIACMLAEEAAEKAEADACEMDVDTYRRWKEDNEDRELITA